MRLTRHLFEMVAIAAVIGSCIGLSSPALPQSVPPAQGGSVILPTPAPSFGGVIGRKASESKPDFPKAVTAPKGAPNILLILTDDTGFGAASTFGGPIPTPTLDRVAARGLRYNNFTPRRCARLREPRFSPAAIITVSALATSRSSLQGTRAMPPSFPRAPVRSATFSSTMVTTRRGLAKII